MPGMLNLDTIKK